MHTVTVRTPVTKGRDKKTDLQAAIHGAGHAVAAIYLGFPVKLATPKPRSGYDEHRCRCISSDDNYLVDQNGDPLKQEDYPGHGEGEFEEKLSMVLLAGRLAEENVAGASTTRGYDWDFDHMWTLVEEMQVGLVEKHMFVAQMSARAHGHVNTWREQIEFVAAALLKHGDLDNAHVQHVLNWPRSAEVRRRSRL
jgi:hypothetical protein